MIATCSNVRWRDRWILLRMAIPMWPILPRVTFWIARNPPFIDGNKRTAAVVSETFLVLNGYQLTCEDVELVVTFLGLAAGEISVEALADWFRANIEPF